ncbi:radical SAM/SPASM domain-containing protein [Rhizobium leguminosarum]|uniref:radical SAM/SPASM domain-containing protein n=1 Tax=Rhizobium leguminosarum TaxID=384 RepID=UPI001C985F37|nr:radical SAM/SPASM domain-containing protein [Rhizobium leguminosarum]MBY5426996.1 radical SAM protein [Rhizobium leguminosarum]
MKNYAIVGFIYNQPCPLKCNFCCHTPDVVGKSKFSADKLADVLQEFSRETSVMRFAFSGGDPFLYLDEIKSGMALARKRGVQQPFHIVTSAYWAKDKNVAQEKIRELSILGMDALDISYDAEHAKFVTPEQIYNAIDACEANDVRIEVFGTFWYPDQRVRDLLPELGAHVVTYENLVMPVGAAKPMFHGRRYNLPRSAKMSCGKPRVYDVAIYPDGEVFPCCSGGFNKEAKLSCGNVYSNDAKQILETVFTLFHARLAKEIGFEALYRKAAEARPDLAARLPDPESVDSVCQICRDIHSDSDLREALADIYDEMELEYVFDNIDKDATAFKHSNVVGYGAVKS